MCEFLWCKLMKLAIESWLSLRPIVIHCEIFAHCAICVYSSALNTHLVDNTFPEEDFEVVLGSLEVRWQRIGPYLLCLEFYSVFISETMDCWRVWCIFAYSQQNRFCYVTEYHSFNFYYFSFSSRASLKSGMVLAFWYWLTEVVLEKRPLICSSRSRGVIFTVNWALCWLGDRNDVRSSLCLSTLNSCHSPVFIRCYCIFRPCKTYMVC